MPHRTVLPEIIRKWIFCLCHHWPANCYYSWPAQAFFADSKYIRHNIFNDIWGPYNNDYEDECFLGCYTV